ncbi:MAG: hypothetical protein JHC70_23880 [Rhodococcus sp.]|nr:hypothetical protein [Rhodococcus sp. (in: high G+C Gram-positive bacteria)]MBJ7325368.1 hypothetical protein [Rhodococcus sp. (in: high G+C Gram-positive bacteria)]
MKRIRQILPVDADHCDQSVMFTVMDDSGGYEYGGDHTYSIEGYAVMETGSSTFGNEVTTLIAYDGKVRFVEDVRRQIESEVKQSAADYKRAQLYVTVHGMGLI